MNGRIDRDWGGGGIRRSSCSSRIGLWSRLLPTASIAYCPFRPLPVHSGQGGGGGRWQCIRALRLSLCATPGS